MLSDQIVTLAGKTFTITAHDQLMMAVSIASGLVFWLAIYFSRKRVIVIKRSNPTDALTFELSRIADALERIANQPADRAIAAAMKDLPPLSPPSTGKSGGVSYSMFGR